MNQEHEEILDVLRKRLPFLEKIGGKFGEDMQWERLPWHFGFLLSAAANKTPGASCFVVDKSLGTTAIAAMIHALVTLQKEFPNFLDTFVKSTLCPGQIVRVKPNNFVYEFAGLWEEYPNLFRLKVLGQPSDSRTFPVVDIVCLEPTKQKSKKGNLKSKLGECVANDLDSLLDLKTCGNNSIFRNTVLLSISQARFATLLQSITFSPEDVSGFNPLYEYLSWGAIGAEGELKSKDDKLASGEPVIAVTGLLDRLIHTPITPQKTVFVDGASGLARNPLVLDHISEHHRVVITASYDETDALVELGKREIPIWYMSPESILIGEPSTGSRNRSSLVGSVVQSASKRKQLKVEVIDCNDTELQAVADSLEEIARKIIDLDDVQEVEKILLRLYSILLELSECCFGVDIELTLNLLKNVQEDIKQTEKWISSGVLSELNSVIDTQNSLIKKAKFGQEKNRNFYEFSGKNWAVVAKSVRTANNLEMKLKDRNIDLPVFTGSNIPTDSEFTGIILPSWPNSRKFSQLKSKSVASTIRILAYAFETKWISNYKIKESSIQNTHGIDAKKLSPILDIEQQLLESLFPSALTQPTEIEMPPIVKIVDRNKPQNTERPKPAVEGEDSRKARFVEFSGNCYALLTEWAELPNLNPLVSGTSLRNGKLEFVGINELCAGDFVLFRDTGDKEIVRILAEDILGVDQYEQTRMIAEKWKTSLSRIDPDPNVIRKHLAKYGLEKTVQTIDSWLSNPHRIGPGDFKDIEMIAEAAGDHELLKFRNEIEDAITRIRGAHISAGGQLTKLILSELGEQKLQVDEQPTQLNLNFGVAWVVHIRMIDTTSKDYPANLVNQLLWAENFDF